MDALDHSSMLTEEPRSPVCCSSLPCRDGSYVSVSLLSRASANSCECSKSQKLRSTQMTTIHFTNINASLKRFHTFHWLKKKKQFTALESFSIYSAFLVRYGEAASCSVAGGAVARCLRHVTAACLERDRETERGGGGGGGWG